MKIFKLFIVLFLSLSSLRLYSNIIMDNDSIYFDYFKYELPVLYVSDNNVCEMLETIVTTTVVCEYESKNFDADKVSYVLEVGDMRDYDRAIFYEAEDKEYCFYVEAYEENDVISFIDNSEYYGVLCFNERLFFIKKRYGERYFTMTNETEVFTLRKRNNTPRPQKYHNGSIVIEIMPIIDPPMVWLFVYKNDGNVRLKERWTFCDNIPDISNYMIED